MKALTFATLQYVLASSPTVDKESSFVFGKMGGVTRYLYENMPSYESAGYVVFLLVFILSAIVYKLGFARKGLEKWKSMVIYIFLFLGCIILTFLALFLPMIEGLMIAALVLIVYKLRLKWENKQA